MKENNTMVLFSFCLDLVVIGICCIFAVKKENVFSIVVGGQTRESKALVFYVQLLRTRPENAGFLSQVRGRLWVTCP